MECDERTRMADGLGQVQMTVMASDAQPSGVEKTRKAKRWARKTPSVVIIIAPPPPV